MPARGGAALLIRFQIIWGAARRGGAAQRRHAAPRAMGGPATARARFLRKINRGAGANAMLLCVWQFSKGTASCGLPGQPFASGLCVREGSEAWRADTLCCVRENPYYS